MPDESSWDVFMLPYAELSEMSERLLDMLWGSLNEVLMLSFCRPCGCFLESACEPTFDDWMDPSLYINYLFIVFGQLAV